MVLDDMNLDDHFIQPFPSGGKSGWHPETMRIAGEIVEKLRPMTVEQRAAVLAKWYGYLED